MLFENEKEEQRSLSLFRLTEEVTNGPSMLHLEASVHPTCSETSSSRTTAQKKIEQEIGLRLYG